MRGVRSERGGEEKCGCIDDLMGAGEVGGLAWRGKKCIEDKTNWNIQFTSSAYRRCRV